MNGPELDRQDARIQDVLDGIGGRTERAALVGDLVESAQARRIYLDYVYLEMALEFAEAEIVPGTVGNVISMDRVLARQKRKQLRLAMAAAAVMLLLGVVALVLVKIPEPPLASFETSPETQLFLSHAVPDGAEVPEGNALAVGSRVSLVRGALELNIGDGVQAVVRAPADFTLRSDSLIDLAHGSAWFDVRRGAVGFQVETPEFLLTDLGTEFGIVSKPDAPDQVHVFTGRVRVASRRGDLEVLELTSGQARESLVAGGWAEIEFGSEAFFTKLPKVDLLPPHIYWSFDRIDPGGGVRAGGTLPVGKWPSARVGVAGEGPVATAGRVGGALKFDKIGDGLISDWSGISGDSPRTIAFWLKLPEDGANFDATLLSWGKRSQVAGSEWSVRATGYSYKNAATSRTEWTGSARVHLYVGGGWFIGETGLARGRWHHVAVCYGGEVDARGRPKADFYVDGKPDKNLFVYSLAGHGAPVDTITGEGLTVGRSRSNPSVSCNAALDELYIFDSKLSRDAIRALANP